MAMSGVWIVLGPHGHRFTTGSSTNTFISSSALLRNVRDCLRGHLQSVGTTIALAAITDVDEPPTSLKLG